MAVSWLFVNPAFMDDGTSDKVLEMIENIKIAFSKFVVRIDWMDKETKLATLEKSRKMKSLIGYPDWLFDDGELDLYYEGVISKFPLHLIKYSSNKHINENLYFYFIDKYV